MSLALQPALRRPRSRGRSILARAGVALLLCNAGCITTTPRPVEPHAVHAAWLTLDARGATQAVRGALPSDDPVRPGFDLENGISLEEAVATALFFNPELSTLRARTRIELAALRHAGAWSDPELAVDGEQILASVPDRLLWSGTIGVTIPLSGRPEVERNLAASRLDAAGASVLGAEWAVVAELRRLWLELATEDARSRLLDGAIGDLESLVAARDQLRAARALSVLEERLLLLELARAQEQRIETRARRSELRLRVLAHLGLHPAHPWELRPSFPALDRNHDREHGLSEFESLREHPDLAIALAAYEVAERTLALEKHRAVPDLTIGLGGGREDDQSRLAFGLGLLPIPVWNRNEAGIETARESRAASRTEVESEIRRLVGRRAVEHERYHAALERLRHLEDVVAPLADAQIEDARRLAALGSLDPLILVEAVEEQRRVRLEVLAARSAALAAQLSLEALTAPCEAHAPSISPRSAESPPESERESP
jgi:cobalt-zinc-cadmium efflux system outer membrane protein